MSNAKSRGSESSPTMPSRGWRVALSAVLLVHLLAVVAPPLSVEGSPVFVGLSRLLGWYVDPLRLNNGYRFFGPDPPQYSFLVDYEAYRADGTVVRGRFPDRQAQWPRLLYHRYFMLSSRLAGAAPPEWFAPAAPEDAAPENAAPADAARENAAQENAAGEYAARENAVRVDAARENAARADAAQENAALGNAAPENAAAHAASGPPPGVGDRLPGERTAESLAGATQPGLGELDAEPIVGPPGPMVPRPGAMSGGPPAAGRPPAATLRRDQPVAADHPYVRSYAQHLAAKYKAVRVKLYLVAHRAPSAEEVRRGVRLHDTLPPREACPLLIDYTPEPPTRAAP